MNRNPNPNLNPFQDSSECEYVAPSANLKCIVFSLVLVLGYWFLPRRNKWVLVALLYFPYLVLAWYDHIYGCVRNMGPTYLALFYAWAKPPESKQIVTYRNWCEKWKNLILAVDLVVLFVILLLVPPFLRWNPS